MKAVLPILKVSIFKLSFIMLLCLGLTSVLGQTTVTYTFSSKSWAANPSNWISGQDGYRFMAGQGVQVTAATTGAFGNSDISFANVNEVVVNYTTNSSNGAGNINVFSVATNDSAAQSGTRIGVSQTVSTSGGTTPRAMTFKPSSPISGFLQIFVECATSSIYIHSVKITYGVPVEPSLSVNPNSLTGFTYSLGAGPSFAKSFSLTGSNLNGTQNVQVLPGENWEVSTNQTTWFTYDNPLILNNYAGAATPIYVRLKAGLTEGAYNNASNDIAVITGYGIPGAPVVTLSGQVNAPLPPPAVNGATVSGTYDTALNYTVTASNSPTSFAVVSGALPGGLSLNSTTGVISGTPTATGSFSVQISATNYTGTGNPAELIFNISKKAQTVTFESLSDKVYGDGPFTLSATASSGFEVTYSSSHPEVATVSGTTMTVIGAGTASITATQAGNSNYESATAVQDLNVTVRPLTVTGLTANHKIQDGTTAATLSGTAELINVVAGDEGDVTLSGTPVGTFASASPGTGVAVTVTGLSLTGDKALNYTLAPLVLNANITALDAPVATAATSVEQHTFTANWNEVAGATEYELDVYTKTLGSDANNVENFDGVVPIKNFVGEGSVFQNGWSFASNGTRQLYTSTGNFGAASPSYAFTSTGDYIQTTTYPSPIKSFSFWAKQQGGLTSYTLIQGYDGSQWITIANLSNAAIPSEGVKTYNLTAMGFHSIIQIKMTFTKVVGNLSVDDVSVSYSGLSNVPVSGSPFNISAPSVSHEVTGLADETEYYYVVKSKSGSVLSPKSNEIKVYPQSVGGTVSPDQTICSGAIPSDFTLNGYFGDIIKWQKSTDSSFSSPEDLNETGAVLPGTAIGPLSVTTYFRAVVQSGDNPIAYSVYATVTVTPLAAAGFISEDQTICYNTQPSDLSLTGSVGTVQWEWSTDNVTFTAINGATSAVLSGDLVGSLTQTTYFRAQLTSGSCSTATSDVITVTVVPNVTVGEVSENQSICYGTQPADLNLTGSTGTIQWQWSTDNLMFTNINEATSVLLSGDLIGNLTATTYFRAQLSNGICTPTVSDVITVTVIPNVTAGPISGPTNIRLGYTAQLSTSGSKGGTWSSSNTDIATVSSNGLVTAIGYGSVDITYTVNSGCGSPTTASVNIQINNTTTWNGSAWDYGTPDASVDAVISGNLTTAERLVSKTLTVNSGIVLTISTDTSFTTGDFANNGILVVESDGNFVQTEGSINSGIGTATVKRNARMKRLDYTYWGSPVHGSQTLKQFSPGTVDTRFLTYNTIDDTFSAVNPNTTVFMPGKGYAIRASNYYPVWTDPTLESNYRIFEGNFKGQPNNGDISLPLEQTGQGYNLMANPYPSNLDLSALAASNSIAEKFYFWSNANVANPDATGYVANNYAVYTATGGTPAENGTVNPDSHIKVGQGFIVKATTGSITFTNAIRNDGTGDSSFINKGKNSKAVIDRYWLTLSTPALSSNTILIGYPEGATNGYDPQFDAEQLGQSTNSFYSVLEDKKLVIQGRQKPMEISDVVPLGLKGSATGQYKISLIKKNGIFDGAQKVYLRDKQNKTVTNLSEGNYTFSSESGIIENRFEIIYVDEVLADTEVKTGELAVYRNGDLFEIKSSQKKISDVEVYDVSGKLLIKVTPNQNHVSINNNSLVNGIYILKIYRSGEIVSKKVIK